MDNINDTYFDGQYKEIWRSLIPEKLTQKEVEFIIQRFSLTADSKVLDIMCGYGRHALALAKHHIKVTAVDNLAYYIDEIKEIAETENLPVQAIQASVIAYQPAKEFDLALCMGNSLNFFNAADTVKILSAIASGLKKGGHLFINTWSLAEIAIRTFSENATGTINELQSESVSQFLFFPTRIETVSTVTDKEGGKEVKTAIDYIFSIAEMDSMLSTAGFKLDKVYSIPGKKEFTIGEPRAYIIAEKI